MAGVKAENTALKKKLKTIDGERMEAEIDPLQQRARDLAASEAAKKREIKELRKDLLHCEGELRSVRSQYDRAQKKID